MDNRNSKIALSWATMALLIGALSAVSAQARTLQDVGTLEVERIGRISGLM